MIGTQHTRTVLRLAMAALVLAVFTHTRADPDLWGHIRFGQDIVAADEVPLTDHYSFTSDRPWVNHEWLAESAMAKAFAVGGPAGLIALKLTLLVAMVTMIVVSLKSASVPAATADLLVGLAIIGTVAQGDHVRPQLFSLALFASLLLVLLRSSSAASKAIVLAVPIMAIWANVHGGWIVGAGTLVVWSVAGLASSISTREKSTLAIGSIAAVTATLANPYGPRLWTFLHDTVGFGRADITDWQPVINMGVTFVFLWVLIAAGAVTGIVPAIRDRSTDRRSVAIVIMLAIASFRVNRLLAFFAISVVMLMGPGIHRVLSRWRPVAAGPRARPGVAATAALTIGLVVFGASAGMAVRNSACIRMERAMFPEPEVARIVTERDLHGRLLVWFDWGEYAIWHFAPQLRVSMDGRRETVYSDAVIEQQLDFYFKPGAQRRAIAALAPDYIWLPSTLPVVNELRSDGWRPLFSGDRSVLLARTGSDATIKPAPASGEFPGARCFPGP